MFVCVHVSIMEPSTAIRIYHGVQADTGWWKPVAVSNEMVQWANNNAMVYKQAWHGRLAHRILRGPLPSGLQESL